MYKLARRFLFQLDAEKAHHLTLCTLRTVPWITKVATSPVLPSPCLKQSLWGIEFPHPIGLAAGLDKNGIALKSLFSCGFSFVEMGTITPRPQPGNPRPRLFRLQEDAALINRMGFNNEGALVLSRRLSRRNDCGTLGINLGKNKSTPNERALDDYIFGLEQLLPYADYIVINVSSPNTPGLRDLQEEEALIPLVSGILSQKAALCHIDGPLASKAHVPVLLKLAPDLSDETIDTLSRQLVNIGIDGFIATNTTIAREGLKSPARAETGGLSGRPLGKRSTEVIRLLYRATNGACPIIGSGGVFTAADAYEKILAGASLVQIYTGFIYEGPEIVGRIVSELAKRLQADGFTSIIDAVGRDAAVMAT